MTPVSIRILAFAAVASLPLLAQQTAPSPQPPTGSSPQATTPQQTNPEPGASQGSNPQSTQVPSTANSPEVANTQLRPVTGELENKLDTKDAKAGDAVVVKTTQAATIGNGTEIPSGSEIKGHIIDVAPKGQAGENARVTIQFDQAQLKGGQSLTIRSVIQSVAPPGSAIETSAMSGGAPATSPSSAAGSEPATGSQPSAGGSSASGASPSQPQTGAAAGGAPAPGTVVATKGNLAIKTTGIPGVLLIGDVNGRPFSNAAGALLGAKQDVQLENGTVMVVAIMTAPPTVGAK